MATVTINSKKSYEKNGYVNTFINFNLDLDLTEIKYCQAKINMKGGIDDISGPQRKQDDGSYKTTINFNLEQKFKILNLLKKEIARVGMENIKVWEKKEADSKKLTVGDVI